MKKENQLAIRNNQPSKPEVNGELLNNFGTSAALGFMTTFFYRSASETQPLDNGLMPDTFYTSGALSFVLGTVLGASFLQSLAKPEKGKKALSVVLGAATGVAIASAGFAIAKKLTEETVRNC